MKYAIVEGHAEPVHATTYMQAYGKHGPKAICDGYDPDGNSCAQPASITRNPNSKTQWHWRCTPHIPACDSSRPNASETINVTNHRRSTPTAEHKLLTILINDPPTESRPSTIAQQDRSNATSPQHVNRPSNSEDTSDTVHWYLRNMFTRFLEGRIPPGTLIRTPTGTHPLTELIIPSWQINHTPPQTVGFFVSVIRSAYAGTSASGTTYGYLNLTACEVSIRLSSSQTSILTNPLDTYSGFAVIAYGQLDKLRDGRHQIRVVAKEDIAFSKAPVTMKRLGQAYRAFTRHDYHLPDE